MPKVQDIQNKISAKFFDRVGNKSPEEIKSLSNKLYDESSTNGVKLGNTVSYVNVPYYSVVTPTASLKYRSSLATKKKPGLTTGPSVIKISTKSEKYYFDFNGDPNTSSRQTRMHAINSYLNDDGNNHASTAPGMSTSGTYNLFWGSKYANSQHLSGAEKPSKDALDLIEANTKANTLYNELWSNNYPIHFDSSSNKIQIGNNLVPKLPGCTVNASTNINEITPSDWEDKTGFALEYQTNASYHSQTALSHHFMMSRSTSGFARAFAESKLTDQAQEVQDSLKIDNTKIPHYLAEMDKNALQSVFEKPDVLSRLTAVAFEKLLDGLPDNLRVALYRLLQPTNTAALNIADTDIVPGNVFTKDFTAADITNKILANFLLKTSFMNVISTYTEHDFRAVLGTIGSSIIDEIADAYTKHAQGINNDVTATNYRRLGKTEIGFLSSNYRAIVEQAASELAGIAVHKFKSMGKVYVPDYTKAVNTDFQDLPVGELTSWRGKNLQNMAEFEDNLPRLRIGTSPFNYS